MTGGEEESVVVVGTRPTLPNHQVDMEEPESSLRCRGSYGSSPETVYSIDERAGPTASTPAQEPLSDYERRSCPSFGTPGSLADLCPDQLYLAPLDVRDTPPPYQSPSPDLKLKMEQGYLTDSGYGGPQLSSSNSSGSRRSSFFDPFPNPEGSYASSSSIWEMFTPVRDLKRKWKGRPSYLDDTKSGDFVDKFSVQPQQLLGCLMLMVISASVGFAFLISFRNFDGSSMERMNSKYKSIEFGSQKLVDKLRREGRLLEEVRDEDGNMLGGKRAAIQFSYEQGLKAEGSEAEVDTEVEVKDIVGEEKETGASEEYQVDLEDLSEKDTSGLAQGILEAAEGLKINDAEVKSLEDEVKELEKQKKRKLELIKKVKMFNTGLMRVAPRPRRLGEVAEAEVAQAEPEEKEVQKAVKPKKSKSHANPLLKSAPKKPKMSKVKASSVVISPPAA